MSTPTQPAASNAPPLSNYSDPLNPFWTDFDPPEWRSTENTASPSHCKSCTAKWRESSQKQSLSRTHHLRPAALAVFPSLNIVNTTLKGLASLRYRHRGRVEFLKLIEKVHERHVFVVNENWIGPLIAHRRSGHANEVEELASKVCGMFGDLWIPHDNARRADIGTVGTKLAIRIGIFHRFGFLDSVTVLDAVHTLVSVKRFATPHLIALEAILRYAEHCSCTSTIAVRLEKICRLIKTKALPSLKYSDKNREYDNALVLVLEDINGRLLGWMADCLKHNFVREGSRAGVEGLIHG